jgi:O-methyltransferase domain
VAEVAAGMTPADGVRTVMEHQRAVWRFAALRALASIGGLEALRDGPLTLAELADRCEASAPVLRRVLRTVASTGLLRTASPGTYELTDAGVAVLNSWAINAAKWAADAEAWRSLGELTETVRTGRVPFVERHGTMYGYITAHPEIEAVFDELMVNEHMPLADQFAKTVDFAGMRTVADVGGGQGVFIAAILRAHPALRGVLVELARVVPAARKYLSENGVADRCEIVAGDFFASVPPGADAYLLSNIVHNWDDEQALAILRTARAAIPPHGVLLLVEAVVPDDDSPHWAKDIDIRILTMHEGQERTEDEYAALLAAAGFRLDSVAELHQGTHVITASPVGA